MTTPSLPPSKRFYQRLLSMNDRVLREVLQGETSRTIDGAMNFFVVDFETTDLSRRWGSVASVLLGWSSMGS